MIHRPGLLMLVDGDAEAWARRFDIEPFTAPCSDCGAPCTTSIPFALGGDRGLAAPDCECGNKGTPWCAVPASGSGLPRMLGGKP